MCLGIGWTVPNCKPGELTRLLEGWSRGDKDALDAIVVLVYPDLRRLAAAHLRRERRDHTLQPTAVVHEAYLRLAGQKQVDPANRPQFFAIASNLIRQILVDHARRHCARKRGDGKKLSLEDVPGLEAAPQLDWIELNEALERLGSVDPRQASIVEMRVFGGLKVEEVADVLGIGPITVNREWRAARAFLYDQLRSGAV
jgi:RNA polymerase sigma factor (TIGR02999 family)